MLSLPDQALTDQSLVLTECSQLTYQGDKSAALMVVPIYITKRANNNLPRLEAFPESCGAQFDRSVGYMWVHADQSKRVIRTLIRVNHGKSSKTH
jgi:hypothetical protein